MPKPRTPAVTALSSRDARRKAKADAGALSVSRRARTVDQVDPKPVADAKTATQVMSTVVAAAATLNGTSGRPKAAPPARAKRSTIGHATLESTTERNARAGKDFQRLTIQAANRRIVVDFSPAGTKATVTVDDAKVD